MSSVVLLKCMNALFSCMNRVANYTQNVRFPRGQCVTVQVSQGTELMQETRYFFMPKWCETYQVSQGTVFRQEM